MCIKINTETATGRLLGSFRVMASPWCVTVFLGLRFVLPRETRRCEQRNKKLYVFSARAARQSGHVRTLCVSYVLGTAPFIGQPPYPAVL